MPYPVQGSHQGARYALQSLTEMIARWSSGAAAIAGHHRQWAAGLFSIPMGWRQIAGQKTAKRSAHIGLRIGQSEFELRA
jgi:hypothetical protein